MITKPKDLKTSDPIFLEWMQCVILPICTVRKVDVQDLHIGIRNMSDINGKDVYNLRLRDVIDDENNTDLGKDFLVIEDWCEGRTNAEIVISLHLVVDNLVDVGAYVLSDHPDYYIQMHSSFEHFLKFFLSNKESEIINAIIVVDSTRIM